MYQHLNYKLKTIDMICSRFRQLMEAMTVSAKGGGGVHRYHSVPDTIVSLVTILDIIASGRQNT